MKYKFKMLLTAALCCLACLLAPRTQAQVPVAGMFTGLVKRVIVAIDIGVQRLQNKTIALQNTARQLENNLHLNSLNGINDWLNREKTLYSAYYQELTRVRRLIADYHTIRQVIDRQAQLVSEYRRASTLFKSDARFRPEELRYMDHIHGGILRESLRNMESLTVIVTDLASQMSDADRLSRIQETAQAMQANLDHLRSFNIQAARLSLVRAQDERDRAGVRKMYNVH